MTGREYIYEYINIERTRQIAKFGDQNIANKEMNPDMKLRILVEEVGEVARAIDNQDIRNLRDELIQIGAVVVGWLESMK